MRLFTTAALLAGLLAASAQGQPSAPAAPVRVEYVKMIPVAESRKLLGMGGNRLYVARKNGSVDAISTEPDGKVLLTLQAKDAEGRAVLSQPEGVAVSQDTIYVVDSEENRVAMFTLDGKYKGRFASKGSGDGALSSPQGLAYAEGIVYVADSGNGRVQLYGDNGVFLSTLNIEGAVANKSLEDKKIPYRLDKPVAVAVDAVGQIYVLDAAGGLFSDNSQIKVYAQNGTNLRLLPKNGKPVAMQMALDGLYVADQDGYAVQKYDTSGKMVSYFGSRGDGRAQFQSLSGLALDGAQCFVGDKERGVVHQFRTVAQVAAATGPKQTAFPFVRWQQSQAATAGKMAWDGKDTLYAVARDKSALLRLRNGAAEEMPLNDITPTALAFDKACAPWVLDRRKARASTLDAACNPVLSFDSDGTRNGHVDDTGDLLV